MGFMPIAPLLAMAVMAPQGAPEAAAAALPEPIVTRQSVFAIPFRIEQPAPPVPEVVELQLFVSGDLGKTWHPYGRQPPSAKQFIYRARNDGVYWFSMTSVDRAGQVRPPKPTAPGLQVIVDTTPPKIELEASRAPVGQVTARWTVQEQNPKPESVVLQFRAGTDGPWREVAVPRERLSVNGAVQTGEVTWWPQTGPADIQVRLEMVDMAGNPAVTHAKVVLIPGPQAEKAAQASAPPGATPPKAAPGPWRPGAPDAPAAQLASNPSAPGPAAGQQGPGTADPNAGAAAPSYPTTGAPGADAAYRPGVPGPASASPSFVAAPVHPPLGNLYPGAGQPAPASPVAGLPPGVRPRMVSTRLFELDYDVQAVGPSGISRVELWGTRDGGRHWETVTLDSDNRSPLLVNIEQEGIYGFKIVVQSGAGLGNQAPTSGDLPDLWVGVDRTRPMARITAAEQGTGPESDNLIISWEAADAMLADRPISLLVGPSPAGPWTPIATAMPNIGRYAWPIDYRAPNRLYLRLEARDEAGNVGSYETSASILLDRARPSVRIRDVRPLGETSQQPRRYYFR